jgi:ABC-type branched-subunit amino acid transport system permease subunit
MLSMVILGGAGSVTGAILGTVLIYSYDKVIVSQVASLLARLWPQNVYIGMVPDIRGTNFFNFGIALYLTVLWRARTRDKRR